VKLVLNLLAGVRALIIFLAMVIFMLSYSFSCLVWKHTKERALRLRKNYLKYIGIPVLNIKVIKTGQPSTTPALYVCNHRSFTDPIVICRYLKAFVIAKAEVANYPIINKGAELTGIIWVNRKDKTSRTLTRDKMVETIKAGYNILVFPEGTVGKDKGTLPFRMGTFIEAAENNIPVVPIAIEFKSPKDMWVLEKFVPQYFHQYSKWKTEVKMTIGEPITGKTGEELHNQAYDWINTELDNMQNGWSLAFKD
jgi:1-acyl-sn-glycerol-3-phosphate acyltransferase